MLEVELTGRLPKVVRPPRGISLHHRHPDHTLLFHAVYGFWLSFE